MGPNFKHNSKFKNQTIVIGPYKINKSFIRWPIYAYLIYSDLLNQANTWDSNLFWSKQSLDKIWGITYEISTTDWNSFSVYLCVWQLITEGRY